MMEPRITMRLPMSKIYRAFPELDRFEAAECEAWVARAWKMHGAALAGMNLLAFAVGGGALLLVGPLCFVVFWRVSERTPGEWGWWLQLAMVLVMMPVLAVPVVGGLWIRDIALRRAIVRQLEGARCVKCRYSLLGLPIHLGAVVCSECGERMTLGTLGLTAADLMARTDGPSD